MVKDNTLSVLTFIWFSPYIFFVIFGFVWLNLSRRYERHLLGVHTSIRLNDKVYGAHWPSILWCVENFSYFKSHLYHLSNDHEFSLFATAARLHLSYPVMFFLGKWNFHAAGHFVVRTTVVRMKYTTLVGFGCTEELFYTSQLRIQQMSFTTLYAVDKTHRGCAFRCVVCADTECKSEFVLFNVAQAPRRLFVVTRSSNILSFSKEGRGLVYVCTCQWKVTCPPNSDGESELVEGNVRGVTPSSVELQRTFWPSKDPGFV